MPKAIWKRLPDEGLHVGDGEIGPRIGFRFEKRSGEVWFGLYTNQSERALFSGRVDINWPGKLRKLADHVEKLLEVKQHD